MLQTGTKTITKNILPDISKGKGNQTIKVVSWYIFL